MDAVDYETVREKGVGAKWYRPSFWGPRDEVLTVVYVGERYILSKNSAGNVFLSAGNADCEFAFRSNGNAQAEARAWARRFEAPIEMPDTCHYCGMPAVSLGFFGEPVCEECGG